MPSSLASYAVEHFFLSGLLLFVGAAVVRWVPAHARHRWLLGALLIAVVGPMLPWVDLAPSGSPATLQASGLPAGDLHSGGGIGLDAKWGAALLVLWGAVAGVRLYRLIAAWRSAGALARRSPRSPEIERRHADLLPAGVQVHLSAGFGPAVLGVLDPCIVLPARLAAQLPHEALRAVLAHEAEHIARRDPAWHALQRAALALLWWNPAMTRLAGWLDEACELACDAGAVRRSGEPVQYAEALLCVAGQPQQAGATQGVARLAMASVTPLLEHRIDAVLEAARGTSGTRSWWGGVLALAMLSAWAAASAAAPDLRLSDPVGSGPVSQSAPSGLEPFSRTAQAAFEQLSQTAQSEYEQLTQSAQSRYEQLSQAAHAEYEQRSQSARRDYERRLAVAPPTPNRQQETPR